MARVFILRYQEIAEGVPTQTRPGRRYKLKPPGTHDHGSLLLGTKTLTEASGEAADEDPTSRCLRIIPG